MANGNPNYQVSNVTVRQAARVDQRGFPFTATILTFWVGGNGPFTKEYAPGMATAQQLVADITATVNQLRDQDSQISTLNQQP